MEAKRILLVDDDDALRSGLGLVLQATGYSVATASSAAEALRRLAAEPFDVVLTDLHMPGAGDGLTVISATRHLQPGAIALLLSADPNLARAADTIRGQADEVIRKHQGAIHVLQRINSRLAGEAAAASTTGMGTEDVASVLEADTENITELWLQQIARAETQRTIPVPIALAPEERSEHLPEAIRDIVFRLRYPQPAGGSALFSMAALQHGARRRRQGIGAVTLVEEFRALQTALLEVLDVHRDRLDADQYGRAVAVIADEIAAQTLQAVEGYENEQPVEPGWGSYR